MTESTPLLLCQVEELPITVTNHRLSPLLAPLLSKGCVRSVFHAPDFREAALYGTTWVDDYGHHDIGFVRGEMMEISFQAVGQERKITSSLRCRII